MQPQPRHTAEELIKDLSYSTWLKIRGKENLVRVIYS